MKSLIQILIVTSTNCNKNLEDLKLLGETLTRLSQVEKKMTFL